MCVCVCVCVGCCGWTGWGIRPWCGCLCVTSTHGDGGIRLLITKNVWEPSVYACLCVCEAECACACVCVCTLWTWKGQCGHTDHYVFVCHDDGLGIFAPETGNSCPVSLFYYVFLLVCVSQMFFMMRISITLYCTVHLQTPQKDQECCYCLFFFHIDVYKLMDHITPMSYNITDLLLVGNFFNSFHCFSFCLLVFCFPM